MLRSGHLALAYVASFRLYVCKFYHFCPLRRFSSHVCAELRGAENKWSGHQFSKPRLDGWVTQAGVYLMIESRNYRFRRASRDANASESGRLISRQGLRDSRNVGECVQAGGGSHGQRCAAYALEQILQFLEIAWQIDWTPVTVRSWSCSPNTVLA
jgi:hypothetical protein